VGRAGRRPVDRERALVNRGEVWWIEHPDAGRRPVCVLSRQAAIPVLRSLLVAPATRTVRGIPSEVVLGPDDGMPAECALSFDNLTTVPKALLTERITAIGDGRMPELCKALEAATGC
jgi:mRNA interferase MazF